MTARELEIGLVIEFGEVFDPDEVQPLFDKIVAVLDLVEIAVHVAVEIAFDVALHDRLGVDEDAGC